MGIKSLSKLLNRYAPNSIKKIEFKDLENKTIAFDTSILIYQFVIAVRNTGLDLVNDSGEMTSHIHAIVTKTLGYLRKKINPIFVFDGQPPEIKTDILKERSTTKKIAKELLESKKDTITTEEKIKLMKKSFGITKKQIKEIKEILTLIGIPIIESPQEADPQCAYLTKINVAYAVASEDLDILTFGADRLIRNISNEKKITIIDRKEMLKELDLTHEEFIDLCIILGCDYCPKMNKIGMKKAYELIYKYKSIENILLKYPKIQDGALIINPKFLENYSIARQYFINPPINKVQSNEIKWIKPNYDKLKIKLISSYSYKEPYIKKVLFKNLANGYYKTISI